MLKLSLPAIFKKQNKTQPMKLLSFMINNSNEVPARNTCAKEAKRKREFYNNIKI